MTKSFFERLTGSMRVRDYADDTSFEAEDAEKRNMRIKENRGKKGKSHQAEVGGDLSRGDFSSVKIAPNSESRAERRFFVSGSEAAEYETTNAESDYEDDGELMLDIFDRGDHFIVQAMMAGVQPEDVDISFNSNNDTLTIRGMRMREEDADEENFYAQELYWGRFSRSVVLPEEVESEKAEASLKNGLLTLKLPKKSYLGTRRIKIRTD